MSAIQPFETTSARSVPTVQSALVRCMRLEARDVLSLELVCADGGTWPATAPGAHLDIEVPGVGARQYSVLERAAPDRLWIGVQRDAGSRGGSRWVHEHLRPGQTLRVGGPRNNFPLDEGAGPVCLIGGGIGITPLLSMADALSRTPREWQLHYGVRSRDRAGFAERLTRHGARVHLHVDDEAGAPMDMRRLVADAAPNTQFYCCGPAGMLAGFADATAGLPPAHCHVEHFAAPATADALPSGSFLVELARSGASYAVPAERSILDVLLDQGIDVPHSCRSGVCGSCETRVIAGRPEHRDAVLSPQERASGKTLMVCCSRAAGERIVLDL